MTFEDLKTLSATLWALIETLKRIILQPAKVRLGWTDGMYAALVWVIAFAGGLIMAVMSHSNFWALLPDVYQDPLTGTLLAGVTIAVGSEVAHLLYDLIRAIKDRTKLVLDTLDSEPSS